MTSCTDYDNPDICPDVDQVTDELMALLPQGRAWDPAAPVRRAFWKGAAIAFQAMEARICALREEFFCATALVTADMWAADYGLPDACDPFPDVCAKVAAMGATRCDYFADVAARAGWSIECIDDIGDCGGMVGAFVTGADYTGGYMQPTELRLVVNIAGSPALAAYAGRTDYAGLMGMGEALSCDPDISGLECIMARIVPAHVQVTYLTA